MTVGKVTVDPVDEDLDGALADLLDVAVRLWLIDHEPHGRNYSTSANEFLHAAEAAYFRATKP